LQQKNIEVFRPLIPTPRNKSYEYFKQAFAKYDIDINEKSVLIGHSCGGTFLVRRLSENDKKIAKLLLVAPRKIWEEKKEGEDLYDFTINPNLNTRVGEITYFTSDDEDLIGKKSLTIFHETLQGNIIELPHHGHYTL
jgi:predicted alpha/beta hydrolase family esterase